MDLYIIQWNETVLGVFDSVDKVNEYLDKTHPSLPVRVREDWYRDYGYAIPLMRSHSLLTFKAKLNEELF